MGITHYISKPVAIISHIAARESFIRLLIRGQNASYIALEGVVFIFYLLKLKAFLRALGAVCAQGIGANAYLVPFLEKQRSNLPFSVKQVDKLRLAGLKVQTVAERA